MRTRPLTIRACCPGFNSSCLMTSRHAVRYVSYSSPVKTLVSVMSLNENDSCAIGSPETSGSLSPSSFRIC